MLMTRLQYFLFLLVLSSVKCTLTTYYNVTSYCDTTSCPKTTQEYSTTMQCPKSGAQEASISQDDNNNLVLTINTTNVWPYPDSKTILIFNIVDLWNDDVNAVIIPTYKTSYDFYYLPCSVQFTDFQVQSYGYYCLTNRAWDPKRIFITKSYFDSTQSITIINNCMFTLNQ